MLVDLAAQNNFNTKAFYIFVRFMFNIYFIFCGLKIAKV